MNYLENIGDDIYNLSSLSFLEDYQKNEIQVSIDWIKSIVESILFKRFKESEKRKTEKYDNRLAFACPYCGDSITDDTRKRGNLFYDTLGYHCFNCGYHTSLLNIVKNYSIDVTNEDMFILKTFKNVAKNNYTINDLLNFKVINTYALDKEYIINKLNFDKISGKSKQYLIDRKQKDLSNFAYDPKVNGIVLFNMNKDNNTVIGFQKRILGDNVKNKYISYKLSKIYNEIGLEQDDAITYIDKLSMIFNIMNISFDDDITVFEGPFDAFLYQNSVATAGITKDFPFDGDNIKYWYDNDTAGHERSKLMIEKDHKVFLWGMYLKDLGIDRRKIKDLTDLIKYASKNSIKLKQFDNYFSTTKLDLYYI